MAKMDQLKCFSGFVEVNRTFMHSDKSMVIQDDTNYLTAHTKTAKTISTTKHLEHKVYHPRSEARSTIIREFGNDFVDENAEEILAWAKKKRDRQTISLGTQEENCSESCSTHQSQMA